MAEKHTYTVHRAMHGEGKDYARGDTRELTEADAASLVATGALSLKGQEPASREPAIRHTFGTDPGSAPKDYTTATLEGVIEGTPAPVQASAAATATPAPAPAKPPARSRAR